MTMCFCLLHGLIYFAVMRGMVAQPVAWRWVHEVGSAFANGLLAVILFTILDKFKQRA